MLTDGPTRGILRPGPARAVTFGSDRGP